MMHVAITSFCQRLRDTRTKCKQSQEKRHILPSLLHSQSSLSYQEYRNTLSLVLLSNFSVGLPSWSAIFFSLTLRESNDLNNKLETISHSVCDPLVHYRWVFTVQQLGNKYSECTTIAIGKSSEKDDIQSSRVHSYQYNQRSEIAARRRSHEAIKSL